MFTFPDHLPGFFTDPKLQREFEQQGFAVTNFYTPEETEKLNTFFHSIAGMPSRGFFPTTFFQDTDIRNRIHDEIISIGQRAIHDIFKDIKIVHGSFIIKNPDKESELRLHQDMSLVDESRFAGVNIWVPLVDLTPENGALYVLPGSHRIFPTYRGASIPNIYDQHTHFIKDYLTPLYLKAGTAVIFDQSIIHYSPPNRSGKVRITTNIFITQKEASFRMYYRDKSRDTDPIEIFEQADDFMTNFMQFGYDIYARPEIGKSLGFTDYNFPVLNEPVMQEKYGFREQPSLLKKIMSKIRYARR